MKHKYRDILTVSWRMSFPFTCRAAHVYAGLYRASQKYPAPFRHHSIQEVNTVYERLTTKNIHSYSGTGRRKPCNSRKEPAETLDFSGLAEMERFELSRRFEPTYRISSADPSTTWVHLRAGSYAIMPHCCVYCKEKARAGRIE